MKKIKIKGYLIKTWEKGYFKQVALIPCPYITYNPLGHFIEQGVNAPLLVLSVNFLVWDLGVQIYYDLEL